MRLTPCRDHSDRAQRLLRRFKRVQLCSYRVRFPGAAEITEEHPPKRQQQAAAAKAPEITPFTS
ncbi:hypothetical protein BIZ24_27800 [Klebsiella pneumoniae]|nr:hypothetical protein [Klebsiella pneumoniae]EIW8624883.1 hypothetical protein [Klebsiella pneumoniae]EIW9021818.1 hypothetical protein [Klebsiella pneumoniae]EIW9038429.1 hypothetical protein [Klebsiella pneumoniae]HBW8913424.1 hypothetical protein [Klebsiella pneumoniae subsp. pneumoniae 1158]